jgi:hypothetical protein
MKKLFTTSVITLVGLAVLASPAEATPPGYDTVDEVNFQEMAATRGFTDHAAGRDNLEIGYEVCAMQDEGYGYQTLTGYVIDEFPNMVPLPDTYQAAVGVIIPASTYLCPRHQAAWENY